MYCENCGKKVKVEDNFCENCGHKLKKVKQTKKPNIKKPEVSKKTLAIIIIALAIVLGLISAFLTVRNMCKPENVALDYFKAITSNDADKIYSHLNVPDKEFTSKKVFESIMEADEEDEIMNYTVTNTNVSADNLEAEVTIKYVTENGTENMTISLVRDKTNKWLFFDNWKVNDEAELVENFKIKVAKDTEVTLAGTKLTEDYLDEEESDDETDVYTIPYMFKMDYPTTATYKVGLTINKTVNPSGFSNRETLDFSLDDLSEKDKKTISEAVLDKVQKIYDDAIDGKIYDEVSNNFTDDFDTETYNDFKDLLNERFDADNLKFFDVKLNRVSLTDEGDLNVSFKTSYSYENNGQEKANAYSKITFEDIKDYKIKDFQNFKTYF